MMVLSSQASHFKIANKSQKGNESPRRGLTNGNSSFDDSRKPRSPNPVTVGHTPQPGVMYVRALYNYAADDPTSLSFHQGDVIQVLTQLESGWWDGIVNGQRGWFPSNYCALIANSDVAPEEQNGHAHPERDDEDDDDEDDFDDGYDDNDDDSDRDGRGRRSSPQLPLEGLDDNGEDEAAFWLPQVTPDGRLYYYNTLTRMSKMELPLETPSSNNETGPRDRTTYSAPEHTRPPAEMMVTGFERDEAIDDYQDEDADGESGSDRDEDGMIVFNVPSPVREDNRPSLKSNRSSAQSVPSNDRATNENNAIADREEPLLNRDLAGSTASLEHDEKPLETLLFFDDILPIPPNWDELVKETQEAVERYREAIQKRDRVKYVSGAEDISDMLRLLIGAGSSTTDNHSGQPTIISSNKVLHPHFRHFMAAFSKLVLSSHVASTDWPPTDAETKCLAEADEVMAGVLDFAKIARIQKEDVVPRLTPGFVVGSNIGGTWPSNGLSVVATTNGRQSVVYGDRDVFGGATTPLDSQLVERLDALKGVVLPSLRQLDNALETPGPISTAHQQGVVGAFVISAAQNAVDSVRAYFHFIESINLSPLAIGGPSLTVTDFAMTKQRLYDSFADLILSCQHVTAPLSDEWSSVQGLPLEDRLNEVKVHIKEVEQGVQGLIFTVQLLVEEQETRAPFQAQEARKASDPDAMENGIRGQNRNTKGPNRPRRESSGAETMLNDASGDNMSKNPKIWKIFGEGPPGAPGRPQQEETPWFLGTDCDDEAGIAYDNKQQVKGGTLEALVERLTRHDFLDSNFNNTFLLTYRSFTTASQLFDLLTDRFIIQPPTGLTPSEYEIWMERKQKPIRLRVFNILKSWFETFWMEPKGEKETELLHRVHQFVKEIMAPAFPGASVLLNLVEQREQGRDPFIKKMVPNLGTFPPPVFPKNMKKLKFLDIDPLEFARQLTVIESRAYTKIKPTECLGKAWSKNSDQAPDPAENVKAMILHSNQLTNWVAEMILNQPEVKKRVVVIKHFISVAEKCRGLNNFSTLTAIISALSTSPIHRLRRTWDQVPTRTIGILESMRTLMGTTRNFGEYRDMLHVVNPPCVPFLGVYLTDLTFIEDGNPDFIKKTNLINFAKRAKTAEVIREIQQYQSVLYPLQAVQELQEYILSNMQAAKDVHEMYDVSLMIEPREREDEKIARLLQESGFL